jgi:hypothetical protein
MAEPERKMSVFVAVWFAGLLSLTGTAMTAFALGVWVYRTTGSATQFAAIVTVLYLPQVVITAITGLLADRYSRRRLMLVANIGAFAVSSALGLTVLAGGLTTIVVYVATLLFSVCSAIQYPAWAASVPLLVPARHLVRANGMTQLSMATSRTLAPAIAAALLPVVGILGIVLIDLATFGFMVVTLTLVRIPRPVAAPAAVGVRRFLRDIGAGWAFIIADPGLLRLLGYFALANVAGGFLLALLPPLVLDFGSSADLGLVQSVGGVGLLIGAVVMIAWGGPQRRVPAVLISGIVFGLGIVLLGLGPVVPLVAAGMFVFAVAQPVINACNAAIWQTRVPPEMQGRAQGTLRMVAFATVPVSAIVAGGLADGVFEPLMRPGGPLAGTVGAVIGTGPGRGTALLLIIIGLLPVLAGAVAFLSRAVRDVDGERPSQVAAPVAETTS